jgi:RNA polymerase sigma-70 factor (ECF subfamily)
MVTVQEFYAVRQRDEGETDRPPGPEERYRHEVMARVAADEAALLQAGRAGDLAALDRLLAAHKHALFVLCSGILGHAEDAEDAVQETFLRALHGLARFRGESAFRSWLFRIAINVCLRWKAGRRPTELWDEERSPAASSASPEAIALGRLQVMEALRHLTPPHRALLLLKEREGWSAAEIAAALGWNEKRVYNELYKARCALADWRRHAGINEGERR